jgi:hypothetical protein
MLLLLVVVGDQPLAGISMFVQQHRLPHPDYE